MLASNSDFAGDNSHAHYQSERCFCAKCGGHLLTKHPGFGVTDLYAATIPSLAFLPALHVNYAETVLPMRDGLPKFKDFPADFGGPGEMVAEPG